MENGRMDWGRRKKGVFDIRHGGTRDSKDVGRLEAFTGGGRL